MPEVLEFFYGGERGEVPVKNVIGSFEPIRPLGDDHGGKQSRQRNLVLEQEQAGDDAEDGVGEGEENDVGFGTVQIAGMQVPVGNEVKQRVGSQGNAVADERMGSSGGDDGSGESVRSG